jgi:hypothetical protein
MKIKVLLAFLIAGTMFNHALLGQTAEMTGKVIAVSTATIMVQKGTEIWDIKRSASTTITGTPKVGSTVTVKYNSPDAQKKEGPTTATEPTATPASR